MASFQEIRYLSLVENQAFGDFDLETIGRQIARFQLLKHAIDQGRII